MLLFSAAAITELEQMVNHMNWAAISAIAACLAALFSLIVTISEKSKDRARRKPRLFITKVDPSWVSGDVIDPANIEPITIKIANAGQETVYNLEVTFENDQFYAAFRKFMDEGELASVGRADALRVTDTGDSFLIESVTGRYQASKRTLPLRHALYPTDSMEFDVAQPYTELFVKYLQLMSSDAATALPAHQYLKALDEAPSVRLVLHYSDPYEKKYTDVFDIKSQLALRSPDNKGIPLDKTPQDEVSPQDLMIQLSVAKQT